MSEKNIKRYKKRAYSEASLYVDVVSLTRETRNIHRNMSKADKIAYGDQLLILLRDFILQFSKTYNNSNIIEKRDGILKLYDIKTETMYLLKYCFDIGLPEGKHLERIHKYCGLLDKQLDGWLNKVNETINNNNLV